MERIISLSVLALIVATSLLCFAGLMQCEQATAQNVAAVYLSLHGGAK